MNRFQKVMRLASVLALGIFVVGYAPLAHATFTPDMWLCMSDNAGGCVSGANYVEAFADGTNIAIEKNGTSSVLLNGTSSGPLETDLKASIGGFAVNLSEGIVNATSSEVLDLSWQATTSGAGTLYVFWGATGFTGSGPWTGGGNGNFSGSISSVTVGACVANTNTMGTATAGNPGTGGTALPTCGGSGTQGNQTLTSNSSPVNLNITTGTSGPTSPFSLEQTLKIVSTSGSGQTSGDFMLSSVPEPTSVALLGGVLMLTFGAIRRKFRV